MTSLLAVAAFGILASLATEAVTWLNKKLSATVLAGDGALILAIVVSFLGGIADVLYTGTSLTWANLGVAWTEIFSVSQVVFAFIVKKFNIDVKGLPSADNAGSKTTPASA